MNEIKRGLFKDHYKNGESKTLEAQENEKLWGVLIGIFSSIFIVFGFMAYIIFGV